MSGFEVFNYRMAPLGHELDRWRDAAGKVWSSHCVLLASEVASSCTCPKRGSALRDYLRRRRAALYVSLLRAGSAEDDRSGIRLVIPDARPLPPWARPWEARP